MSYEGKLRAQFIAFHGGRPAAARYERPKLPVRKTYCVLITPRSGNTWLSRRISRLDVLSCPEEYFIAEEFASTLEYNPGHDIYEVFDIVAQKNCTCDGLFGFEMSYFDLEEFEREAPLIDVMLGERHFFYLNRRNFVAQAISLHTAVESRVFHTFGKAGARQPRPTVPYDDDKIMYWVCHILQQEFGIRQWLRANKIKPVSCVTRHCLRISTARLPGSPGIWASISPAHGRCPRCRPKNSPRLGQRTLSGGSATATGNFAANGKRCAAPLPAFLTKRPSSTRIKPAWACSSSGEVDHLTHWSAGFQLGKALVDLAELDAAGDQMVELQPALLP
jgi:LPS sulfotransferase NodH